MRLIGKIVVGSGGASTIEFTSIPSSGYTDLMVHLSARTTKSPGAFANIKMEFNGSTTGYSDRTLYTITGTSAASAPDSVLYALQAAVADATANVFGNSEAYIPTAFGSTAKSVSGTGVNENNGTVATIICYAGLWTGTDAITSIKLTPDSGTFVQHSAAYLFGISKA